MRKAPSGRTGTRPPPLGPPPAPHIPRPLRWTLPNGLRVLAVRSTRLPRLALKLVLPGGTVAEPSDRAGTAALVSALLTEGTHARDAAEINARIDGLGASFDAQAGHDFATVDALLLSETAAEAIPLFFEIIASPSFPDSEFERIRAETLDAIAAREDEPANAADDAAALRVLGANHPYGRLAMGTPEGVAAISRGDLLAFHAAQFRPATAFLLVAGDFEPGALSSLLAAASEGWSGSANAVHYPPLSPLVPAADRTIRIGWEGAAQAEIRLAARGLERSSPDWVPASITNYILGGSTITGRLGANLREDKGWTYGARSAFSGAVQPGGWFADAAVDLEVADAALEEMLREVERMTREPVGADELRRAKDALILSLPRAFQTPGRITHRFATLEMYGLPGDYWAEFPDVVERVTAEDVLRVAQRYLAPDRLTSVIVGGAVKG